MRTNTEKDKYIGYMAMQRADIEPLVLASTSEEEFLALLEATVDSNATAAPKHLAHLCKNARCNRKEHIPSLNVTINIKNHETCPAYWIINGHLHNFCTCHHSFKCLVPGPSLNVDLFRMNVMDFVHKIKS